MTVTRGEASGQCQKRTSPSSAVTPGTPRSDSRAPRQTVEKTPTGREPPSTTSPREPAAASHRSGARRWAPNSSHASPASPPRTSRAIGVTRKRIAAR